MSHECPSCHGDGYITGLFPVYAEDCASERKPSVELTCDRCQGTGNIPDEMLEWIERGRKLREDRKSRGMTLRKEAEERGMLPSELSRIERGIVGETE